MDPEREGHDFETMGIEDLKSRQQEVQNRIMELEAEGQRDDEWNRLHNEFEELGMVITAKEAENERAELDEAA